MEPTVLTQARQQLAWRLAVFTTGLLLIFSLQTNNQIRENNRSEQQRQLQILGLLAINRLAEISAMTQRASSPAENPESTGIPKLQPGRTLQPGVERARESDIRILWIGPAMNILDEYGTFVPAGPLLPAPQKRLEPQSIPLSNGAALWLPLRATSNGPGPGRVLGFVAVASAEAPGSRSAGISLITATAASVVLALLGIPWILERSLQPMREQINRLRQFAGDVAHELRNPLMALKTTVANTRVHLPQPAREPVQMSLTSLDTISTRMATILDDVLLLARIENGTDDIRETAAIVDMAELFDELSVLHDSEARARSVNLHFTIDGPLQISVIPTRVQRILSNLISNAIRFSAIGGTVDISAFRHGKMAQIRVDDAGPGIPRSDQERVFERFVQLSSDPNRSHAGLGLALSRSLAQLHGGSLEAQQSPAGGCRMLLQLPLPASPRRWKLWPKARVRQ